ncbi:MULTISPECIES: ABC transporter substrate-binding protein [unclassified Rhizobium]|uniref:ABC transporter substrate-binding protein n=1 Tax=unclassified Rhizobium TaxID=2613769 RepID=UPI001611D12E|nr:MULTISPECIES: ABC transporter substrate-binding protein [unclassified Rhizobium]MBB3544529.1 NitT/TauT family transport system substrate-binding protein [Rhizobium sp. BK399]MCS3744132.1 NitT/TauT family transport system substrate-binding protein [Rhizobium sp. BK661]MCS4095824.1 NitT/TauT family transport system substrate-binding protein [Rhizobium sp. BK176]
MNYAIISRHVYRGALALGIVGALAFSPVVAQDIPAKPEAGTFKIGIEPWLGYGQWHVAASKDLFKKANLENVELVNFTEDKDINAALASGQLDAANIATHTAMGMVAAGLPVKIVSLLDFSLKADAILAGSDVKSVADLKGKKIAFEEGTTSDILLNYALASNGMTIKDIERVPMPAADAGTALIAGQVPVAVTYEPYISTALAQDKNIQLLFEAGKDPGLVSDVLVVREEVLKERPGQVLAMIKAWDAALADYKANTEEDRAIIAKAVGASPDDLKTAFDGVQYYTSAEASKAFAGDFKSKTFADVLKAAKQAGLLTQDVSADSMIDTSFVDAANK